MLHVNRIHYKMWYLWQHHQYTNNEQEKAYLTAKSKETIVGHELEAVYETAVCIAASHSWKDHSSRRYVTGQQWTTLDLMVFDESFERQDQYHQHVCLHMFCVVSIHCPEFKLDQLMDFCTVKIPKSVKDNITLTIKILKNCTWKIYFILWYLTRASNARTNTTSMYSFHITTITVTVLSIFYA